MINARKIEIGKQNAINRFIKYNYIRLLLAMKKMSGSKQILTCQ